MSMEALRRWAAVDDEDTEHGLQFDIELSTPIPRWRKSSNKLGRAQKRGRPRACFIILIGLGLLLFLANFARLSRYRFELAAERIRRVLQPSTLVFDKKGLQSIWEWEILSGHYPTRKRIPKQVGLHVELSFPLRQYVKIEGRVPYPRRPLPGSIADFDRIMRACDLERNKYDRDCLQFLAEGGGLHGSREQEFRYPEYMFVEENTHYELSREVPSLFRRWPWKTYEPALSLPPPLSPSYVRTEDGLCDLEHPRIFHMFWMGPISDKVYVALLSFLYTQNLGLHLPESEAPPDTCRPQFWIWIDVNPASPMPAPNAKNILEDELKSNAWSSPFLHPRFRRHVHFKLWNATEQLDSIPELKDEWRHHPSVSALGEVFNIGDKRYGAVFSDLARFILLHRFGGIYVDGDLLFLRDWEELWGWQGPFAYRWAMHDQYNTAVLRMNKASALGSFFFHTAMRNDWDFHPHTLGRYLRDAHSMNLLYRLPSALFDPDWLFWEGEQRDRPPKPAFLDFNDFASSPSNDDRSPFSLGFNGFFRGAYGYHSHISSGKPFDTARNWPDLGPRFNRTGPPSVLNKLDHSLSWAAVLKRTFEGYIRGEQPNMYGEWIQW